MTISDMKGITGSLNLTRGMDPVEVMF